MQGYSVKNREIFRPGWIDSTHYNVLAKVSRYNQRTAPSNVPESAGRAVPGSAAPREPHDDRIRLNAAKLKEYDAAADANRDDRPAADGKLPIGDDGFQGLRRSSLSGGNGRARMQGNNVKIASLAEALSRILDPSITDKTGLTGPYDVSLI